VEAKQIEDPSFTALWRLFLANRGVWEAIPGAGPTVAVPGQQEDVDQYVAVVNELLDEVRASAG
jgi:glutamate-1-semialdehyde 2,1-aminomutase